MTDHKLPNHVAIVMDGNGRWATNKGKTRSKGHRQGKETLKTIVAECLQLKIPYLSVFAFSSENWGRPNSEVKSLLNLFLTALNNESRELAQNGVRLTFFGDLSKFSQTLKKLIDSAEKITCDNHQLRLNVAINYGGRWDIVNAAKKLSNKMKMITEKTFSQELCFANSPEVDLFIRTGNEQRVSNFMLWQIAYAEMYFCNVLWPDFNAQEFHKALKWFTNRERRFGKIN